MKMISYPFWAGLVLSSIFLPLGLPYWWLPLVLLTGLASLFGLILAIDEVNQS